MTPALPEPRGRLSEWVIDSLAASPDDGPPQQIAQGSDEDCLWDDDFQLALYVCYELHYRGFDRVDPEWEWAPSLLAFRRSLERAFAASLHADIPHRWVAPPDVTGELQAIAQMEVSPSITRYVASQAGKKEAKELLVHRSIYHLKEADPHTWAIPRLGGKAKVALAEIQSDEYGSGRPDRLHAQLFADAMTALGLDPTYGAYVNSVPGVTLGALNLMSMFGLHRRWRGAVVGHLALFEMTSSEPNRRLGDGLRRLGYGPDATAFFDEHVEADSVHEVIALHDLAGALAMTEPELAGDIVFGALCLQRFDQESATRLMAAWSQGRSSLLEGTGVVTAQAG